MADKTLTINDIDSKVARKVYTQDYSSKPSIDGVRIINVKNHVVEGGDFTELFRIRKDGNIELEELPSFKIAQINRTMIFPEVIKAWHLHLKQDEIWYIAPSSHLFVGLWDVRKKSETSGSIMRIVLGGGDSKLLFIPRGVAHGCANFSKKPVDVYYFINGQFDKDNPDEKRISWDALGKEFWYPQYG